VAATSRQHALTMATGDKIRIAILGASGYTGAELIRILLSHPSAELSVLTGNTQAGQSFYTVFPQFSYAKVAMRFAATSSASFSCISPVERCCTCGMQGLPILSRHEDHDWKDVDCVFCCLPHATTQDIIKALPEHLKIIDLSADFRLKDVNSYAEWYGGEHRSVSYTTSAVVVDGQS
jgi:N-acetyl-gamma-glutamyl-phosphate reductase